MVAPTLTMGATSKRTVLDMDGYQWTVLFAAWLGWGFDIFDGLLFSYVAPNCIPTLLGLSLGSPQAKAATLAWTGVLTSLLLIGWAGGGIFFGWLADRIGRMRTLLLTMALYSLGTALCAFAPNIWILVLCRLIASLGIGGEWAAGAAMVAEVVPEKRRVEAGALLYTASPMGLFLATFVTYQVAGVHFKSHPEVSWRYVFLFGLLPACVAFLVRLFVKESKSEDAVAVSSEQGQKQPPQSLPRTSSTAGSEVSHEQGKEEPPQPNDEPIKAAKAAPPTLRELFTPEYRRSTLSGFLMALTALLAWWSCNAFIPIVATGLAQASAKLHGLDKFATQALGEHYKVTATSSFNLGGLLGILLTIPIAKGLGRRPMFAIYFVASAISLLAAFGLNLPPEQRLLMYFPIGLSVFGVFGSFTFYLPELFPKRLRATGAGFCYNVGRVIAALGPFLVGRIASQGADSLTSALTALFWVGFVPLAGLLALPWVIETRGRMLSD